MGGPFFYRKEKQKLQGMIDIHCHILPEVDDGARTQEEAVRMLRMQKRMGVERVILTPHYAPGMFTPSVSEIYKSYRRIELAAAKSGIQLLLGREYHISQGFDGDLQCHQLPVIADTAYVLIEFSEKNSYHTIREVSERMLQQRYRPVIAHIERYPCLRMTRYVEELGNMGVCLQLNAGTVISRDEYCWKLIRQNLIHFIASDAHRMNARKPNLGKCFQMVRKKMGEDYAEKIFCRNPLMLIENKEIE